MSIVNRILNRPETLSPKADVILERLCHPSDYRLTIKAYDSCVRDDEASPPGSFFTRRYDLVLSGVTATDAAQLQEKSRLGLGKVQEDGTVLLATIIGNNSLSVREWMMAHENRAEGLGVALDKLGDGVENSPYMTIKDDMEKHASRLGRRVELPRQPQQGVAVQRWQRDEALQAQHQGRQQ